MKNEKRSKEQPPPPTLALAMAGQVEHGVNSDE